MQKIKIILLIIVAISLVILILLFRRAQAPIITTPSSPDSVASDQAPIVAQTQAPAPKQNTSSSESVAGRKVVVRISDFMFNPAVIEIEKGDKIIWINSDSVPHIITSDKLPEGGYLSKLVSPTLEKNQMFEFEFAKTGDFGYHCQLHPSMKAVIKVK